MIVLSKVEERVDVEPGNITFRYLRGCTALRGVPPDRDGGAESKNSL